MSDWKKPWHKREHGKALNGMRGMSLELRGAYNTLLDYMYDQGGPVRLDERRLCGELECDIRVFKRVMTGLIAAGKVRLWSDGERVWVVNDKVLEVVGADGFKAEASVELSANLRDKFAIAIEQLSPTSGQIIKENNGSKNGFDEKNRPRERDKKEPPLVPQGDDRPGEQLALVPADAESPDEVRQAFDLWNGLARAGGLPVAQALTDVRRRAIRKRLKDAGMDGWREALKGVELSAFCRGQRKGGDGRVFKADIDFVCQAKSFQRLIERYYREDAAPVLAKAAPIDPLAVWRRRIEAYLTGSRYWNTNDWGGKPGQAGCGAPAAVLAEFGFGGAEIVPFPLEGRAA